MEPLGQTPVTRDELEGALVEAKADFLVNALVNAILLACIYNLDCFRDMRNPWVWAVAIPLGGILGHLHSIAMVFASRGGRTI